MLIGQPLLHCRDACEANIDLAEERVRVAAPTGSESKAVGALEPIHRSQRSVDRFMPSASRRRVLVGIASQTHSRVFFGNASGSNLAAVHFGVRTIDAEAVAIVTVDAATFNRDRYARARRCHLPLAHRRSSRSPRSFLQSACPMQAHHGLLRKPPGRRACPA